MKPSRPIFIAIVALVALAAGGCQTTQPKEVLLSTKSPVELRAMQSRAFDTTDRIKMLRTVIATLQDLGYTIEKAEAEAGTITANKLGYLALTATVYPRGEKQLIVRANAVLSGYVQQRTQVDAPEFYQKLFFEPLSKAIFLNALHIDDGPGAAERDKPVERPEQKVQYPAGLKGAGV